MVYSVNEVYKSEEEPAQQAAGSSCQRLLGHSSLPPAIAISTSKIIEQLVVGLHKEHLNLEYFISGAPNVIYRIQGVVDYQFRGRVLS